MAFGVRIQNEATGSIQVDELYANMALLSKNTVVTGAVDANGISSTSITYTSTAVPLLAFACTSPAFVNNLVRDDIANTWTFVLRAEGASRSITCYEFGEAPVLGAGFGLKVWKASGEVAFDSRHKYAAIASTLRGTFDTMSSVGAAGPGTTLAAGRTYAVMMGGLTSRRYLEPVPGSGGYTLFDGLYLLAIQISSNVLSSKFLTAVLQSTFYPIPPSPPMPSAWSRHQTQYSWAILDVTGF